MADASKIYSHDVEANIDERIVKPLIDMNFDVVDGKYPQFRFKALTAEEKQAQFDTYINGVNSKALTKSREDENFLRKRLEVRARRSPVSGESTPERLFVHSDSSDTSNLAQPQLNRHGESRPIIFQMPDQCCPDLNSPLLTGNVRGTSK